MRKGLLLVLTSLLLLFFTATVYAEVKFNAGASMRLRQEIWDNVVTLGTGTTQPDRNFFRLRTSVWGSASLADQAGLYLRLTNEAKYYTGPYKLAGEELDEDELIVDNLYFDVKKIFNGAVDLRIGRQDFLGPTGYGEGFIILDGTPGDGSRSFYFNAAKATIRLHKNHSVDLIYISDPTTDIFMPSLHPSITASGYIDNKKQLTGSDETGFVVYSRNKLADVFTIEPYYVYKTEDPVGTNTRLKLNTVGMRAVYKNNGWYIRGEFAHQFGEYASGRDRKGNGGYVSVARKYEKVALKPEWELGYVYLSGDDPNTADHEGWDPLFSRAPMWNELIIYTLIPETSNDGGPIPGYWTNMHILRAHIKLVLAKNTGLNLGYNYLLADEKTNSSNTAMFSNDGKERGHLPMAILSHKFSKNVDGFLQAEYFIPGNFYAPGARNATFIRWQLQVRI